MKRSPSFTAGCLILGVVSTMAILGAVWTPYDALAIDAARAFESPSLRHLLGTDQLGRDILSILMDGSRTSLLAAIMAVSIAMSLGVALGVVAGASVRQIDDALTALLAIGLAFPALLLALILAATYGPSTTIAVVAIGLATSVSVALVTRNEVRQVMESVYVLAAQYSGATKVSIIRHHVLRNVAPSVMVQASGAAAIAIAAESTLSYLGLGTTPPNPSWGRMLASTQQYILVTPLIPLWPAVVITLAIYGCNLLGDGLRERLDPTLD